MLLILINVLQQIHDIQSTAYREIIFFTKVMYNSNCCMDIGRCYIICLTLLSDVFDVYRKKKVSLFSVVHYG